MEISGTDAVRIRFTLFLGLRSVGPALLTSLVTLTVLASLIPAVTAVAFAGLVGHVETIAGGGLAAAATTALVAYVLILLVGHAVETVRQPLLFLAETRINGVHRADLARLTAASATIGELERAEVQALIRETRADPEHFMDGTPGQGATAQLARIGQALALVSSAVVLAAFAWWLIPLVALPAVAIQQLESWEAAQFRGVWRRSVTPSMHADVWADAIVSPAEGKEIRVFGLAGWAVDRIQHHVRTGYDPLWTVGRRVLARQWQPFLLVLAPLGAAYVAVTVAAGRGETSVGVAAAVFAAAMGVFGSLTETPPGEVSAITAARAYDDLREKLGPDAPRTREALTATDSTSAVRFEDVSFAYPGTDRLVLDHLDLEIRPGELLGIVGLNGAGKSTLIKLLAGLYEPTAGRITADGGRIAVVFQDFVRYHLSAADNVALGNAAVPRDEESLASAARDAGLDEVLDRLPDGWNTPLARTRTGGVDLSGGQWQQVVLARALYAVRTGARLLVLDEPTAHLDVRTEFDVFGRLAAQRGDAAVVLISHRLSTVRRAHRIVLVSGGRIAEEGSHDELMARSGEYAAMFTIQADRFKRGYDDRIDEEEGDLS
jgi:ATP-binding cassette subfamily B protein